MIIRLTIIGEPCSAFSRVTYIYALTDPNGVVRYVGKSDAPMFRYRRHLEDASDTHKARWIRALASVGAKPTLHILQVVAFEQWQEAERRWIARLTAEGAILTNSTEGGKGPLAPSPETREKMRQRKLGGKQSIEHRRKVSAALKGRPKPPRSAEHIAKIAATRIGVSMGAAQLAEHRERNLRRKAFGSTGIKGVSFDKARQRFAANIKVNQKYLRLGRFHTAIEAARAYNAAALAHGWPMEGLNQI